MSKTQRKNVTRDGDKMRISKNEPYKRHNKGNKGNEQQKLREKMFSSNPDDWTDEDEHDDIIAHYYDGEYDE